MMFERRNVVAALLAASASLSASAEEWIRLPGPHPVPQREHLQGHIDLRVRGALEGLQSSNPRHFGQIRRILVRMREAPSAGPGHWFPKHVRVKDIEFSELVLNPAFPPSKLLRFTLDEQRYTLDVPLMQLTPWCSPCPPRVYPMRERSLH